MQTQKPNTTKAADSPYRPSSGKSLADYQGRWAGDDFDACLQLVHTSRSQVDFFSLAANGKNFVSGQL